MQPDIRGVRKSARECSNGAERVLALGNAQGVEDREEQKLRRSESGSRAGIRRRLRNLDRGRDQSDRQRRGIGDGAAAELASDPNFIEVVEAILPALREAFRLPVPVGDVRVAAVERGASGGAHLPDLM